MPIQRSGEDRISQLLRRIRGDRRQVETARLSGWTQSSISRGEHGRFTPSPDQAEAYARALDAPAETRRELVRLVRAAAAQQITGQSRLWRSGAAIQHKIAQLERQSRLVRAWQPELVPGLLQTWDYTLAVVGPDPGEQWSQRRRERVALLDDISRTVDVLVSEAVLLWAIGSTAVMAAQCAHLVELSERANVRLGLLPFGPILPPAPPSFDLYADRTVVVETYTGVSFLNDQAEVQAYVAQFEQLKEHGLYGDDARELLTRARKRYMEASSRRVAARDGE